MTTPMDLDKIRRRALAAAPMASPARGAVGAPRAVAKGSPEAAEVFCRQAREDVLTLVSEVERLTAALAAANAQAICGTTIAGLLVGTHLTCTVPAGHPGWHQTDNGTHFSSTPPYIPRPGAIIAEQHRSPDTNLADAERAARLDQEGLPQ